MGVSFIVRFPKGVSFLIIKDGKYDLYGVTMTNISWKRWNFGRTLISKNSIPSKYSLNQRKQKYSSTELSNIKDPIPNQNTLYCP